MKTMKKICYVLMFLPLVITLICMPFLPDRIPTHFGINGTADAWGSKYSILLLPVISILMGYFMLIMAKLAGKQEKTGNNNEKLTMLILCITLCIFCGISPAGNRISGDRGPEHAAGGYEPGGVHYDGCAAGLPGKSDAESQDE